MKKFGNDVYKKSTLTVGELRAILDKYPADMPVLATWEGIYAPFRGEGFLNTKNGETDDYVYLENPGERDYFPFNQLKEQCLIFEVNEYP